MSGYQIRVLDPRQIQRLNAVKRIPWISVMLVSSLAALGCDRSSGSRRTGTASINHRSEGDAIVSQDVAETQHQSTGDYLNRAQQRFQTGDFDSAAEAAYKALVLEPENADAVLIASQVEAARGNHEDSVRLASSIKIESRLGKRAVEAHWQGLLKLNRPSKAADVILSALRIMPSQSEWRHEVWSLLNRVGRRAEASRQVDFVCRTGEATDQELLSLVQRTDAFPFTLESNDDPGQSFSSGLGMARWYFTNHQYERGLAELSGEYETGFSTPAACALYGRLLGEAQRFEEMPAWFAKCETPAKGFGDFWAALAACFIDQRQYEAAAGALLEAVYRNPTDRICVQRLAMVFDALGRPGDSAKFRDRVEKITRTKKDSLILYDTPADSIARKWMLRNVMELGRPFEAIAWTMSILPRDATRKRAEMVAKRVELAGSDVAQVIAAKSALLGFEPGQFQLEPAIEKLQRQSRSQATSTVHRMSRATDARLGVLPRLVNVAEQVGIDFQWYLDVEIDLQLIALHESLGGGIAVVDYDLDGWPDVYLAQGSGDPPTDACTRSNALLRNVQSRFEAVTPLAGAEDYHYSSGLAVGDVNQDGFGDLVLGSVGRNRLLINNGDGTFRDATEQLGKIEDRFTASLAVADINGDTYPDLFETNYIEMEGAFVLPHIDANGQMHVPRPLTHNAAPDRWYENRGDGSFDVHEISRGVARPASSLGIVITDFDSDGSNEVFVGNDVRPNHFLVRSSSNRFRNAADALGIANGFSGKSTACMGIAAGDLNRDGEIDLHVTNFQGESSNLYLQTSAGGFTDFAVRYGLESLTFSLVGFGTKAIDVDRNGWLDLIITNGHIYDSIDDDNFKMPPQLLMNLGHRFEPVAVEDESRYWEHDYLGRSLASLDFDLDGSMDFLIGHLDQPVALLHNETDTDGNWIQFELIGKTSERDAIGARIVVTADGERFTHWVTAGDGYLCSDEPVLDFGIGAHRDLDQVEVFWPCGETQVFHDLEPGHRYLLVEGQADPYRR